MTMAQAMLPEFEQEMANTRKVLERIPDDKLGWKAHPKLNTIGWNACHLVEMVGWIDGILTTDSFDVNPPNGPKYESPKLGSVKEILAAFDSAAAAAKAALGKTSDADFLKNWSLLNAGQPWIVLPRVAMVRSFGISHVIHHRAFLIAYLKMNGVPVPGMYGPSGDE
jgi:uncharacterized damage-inducible protein DinB